MPRFAELSIEQFLAELAAARPTPGGGAVAALTGALATGLGRMAAGYTLGRPRFAEVAGEVEALVAQLARAGEHLLTLMDEDAAAYAALSSALKRPKDEADRAEVVARAAAVAAFVPLETAGLCRRVEQVLERLRTIGNPQLRSDVVAGRALAQAAVAAALENVRANEPLLSAADAATITREVAALTAAG